MQTIKVRYINIKLIIILFKLCNNMVLLLLKNLKYSIMVLLLLKNLKYNIHIGTQRINIKTHN